MNKQVINEYFITNKISKALLLNINNKMINIRNKHNKHSNVFQICRLCIVNVTQNNGHSINKINKTITYINIYT